jgi:hypothetical protein
VPDSRNADVDKRIVGYHRDDEQHWVAELECGHDQHVRHDPPWINRLWVTTAQGRERHLGQTLKCKKCATGLPRDRPR